MDIRTFAKTIGKDAIADHFDVSVGAVDKAIERGHFNSQWFAAMQNMARAASVAMDPAWCGQIGLDKAEQ